MRMWIGFALLAAALQDPAALQKSLGDDVQAAWFYNDLDAGFAEAKTSGKPMLVVFR